MGDAGTASKNRTFDERFYSSEYSTSFNPNDSFDDEEKHNDSFPLPLNPLFDLQALVMVS